MNSSRYTDFEARAAAFDAGLYPITVTVNGEELSGSGSVGVEEVLAPEDGGHVRVDDLEVTITKADWTAAGLSAPQVGLAVTFAGRTFAVARVFGRSDLDPAWSLKLTSNAAFV